MSESGTMHLGKRVLVERAAQALAADASVDAWSLQQTVALTCRILSEDGHGYGLAGQISARGARSETFYTQRMGLGFDEIRASTLLLVDEDLNVLAGDGIPNPANRFHAWIYRAYPETQCVIHTHPFHVSAFAMLEQPLVIAHMDTCLLHDDCAFLPQWPGLPFGNDEGAIIAAALGGKRALLMGHHGQLAAGRSVMEACLIAMAMERAARLQLAAQPAGRIVPIPASLATEAHDWLLHPDRVAKVFTLWARRALRSHADCLS